MLGNVSQIEVSLNILNSLIGKEDISIKLKDLIKQYPEVVPVIPFLIAVRGTSIKVAEIEVKPAFLDGGKVVVAKEEFEDVKALAKKQIVAESKK